MRGYAWVANRVVLGGVLVAVALTAAVLTAAGTGSSAASAPTRWVITDLGTLSGKYSYESSAVAINASGEVIGNSQDVTGIDHRGFLWENGRMTGVLASAALAVPAATMSPHAVRSVSAAATGVAEMRPTMTAAMHQPTRGTPDASRSDGSLIALSPTTGAPLPGFPQMPRSGIVSALADDGRGGWYVGGKFSSIGGVACPNLAHIAPIAASTTVGVHDQTALCARSPGSATNSTSAERP